MKKFLLLSTAAVMAFSASAADVVTRSKVATENQVKRVSKFEVAPAVNAVATSVDKQEKLLSKKLDVQADNNLVLAPKNVTVLKEKYNASGTDYSTSSGAEWEMQSGKLEDETPVLVDVIPNSIFKEPTMIPVEYTMNGNDVIIEPQLVASGTTQSGGNIFIYLIDAKADVITLKTDATGAITGKYNIIYGAFASEDPNNYEEDNYYGYYDYYTNITYSLPGAAAVAPVVSFEPENLQLFATLGLSGYQYSNNLSMISANAPFKFKNNTVDKATAWSWTANVVDGDPITATTKDFVINVTPNETYSNVTLVGKNQTELSDPFVWGVSFMANDADTKEEDAYETNYIYAGGFDGQFEFTDGTYAILSRFNNDGDLTFYTNWATPDKAQNSMSKIYIYGGKPAAPLYIEGVTIPVVGGSFEKDFNLHLKIVKATRTNRINLGDVIAEADATLESINAEYAESSGLSAIEFTDLYVEDEDGMSNSIDHLFLDEEFALVIEGWDNGTFSAVPGCANLYDDNSATSVWFEMSSAPGSMYSYTSWKTQLWVGYLGAAYGYLETKDNTKITLPAEGGSATIHIEPMLSGSEGTLLDFEEGFEAPEWIEMEIKNEVYTETEFGFDLVISAEASAEERSGSFRIYQPGAYLDITVSQGAGSSIATIAEQKSSKGIYNIYGQKVVNTNANGLYVIDGKKVIK